MRALGGFVGAPIDALFQHAVEGDPSEILRARRRMKAYLARYGRQSMVQWDDREASELLHSFEDVAELVADENRRSKIDFETDDR